MALKTLAGLGDSLTESATDGLKTYKTKVGWLSYAEMQSNGRVLFKHNLNFGVTSEEIADTALRVGDVIAAAPTYCGVWVGFNDFLNATTDSAQTLANRVRDDIAEPLAAAGIIPILMSVPVTNDFTAAMNTKRHEFNILLGELGYPFAPVAEIIEAAAYPTYESSGVSYDGTHPNPAGYYLVGKAVAAVIQTIDPDDPVPNTNLSLVNCAGIGGAAVAPATGSAASQWTIAGGQLHAQGNLITGFVAPSVTGYMYSSLMDLATMGISVGEQIYIDFDFEAYTIDISEIQLDLSFFTAATALISTHYWGAPFYGEGFPNICRGKARLGPVTVPATATQLALYVNWRAKANRVAQVRRFKLYDVAVRKP